MNPIKRLEEEIDQVQREMARILIQQSDLDNKLTHLDHVRATLERELAFAKANNVT